MNAGYSGSFSMQKFLLAAVAAVAVFVAPAAQAATVFNLTFTGTYALNGSPTPVNGTGTVTIQGGTGSGLEIATPVSSNPQLTDVQINLNLGHFDLGDALVAAFTTFNGDPFSFTYQGGLIFPGIPPKLITFNTLPGHTFGVIDGVDKNVFGGTYEISPAIAGVPEPSTWAMLILGFGGIGVMLRSLRRKQAVPSAVRA